MDKYDLCSQCELPIRPYKQTIQEREDMCENCHIVNIFQEERESDTD